MDKKRVLYKVLWRLGQISRSYKVTSFEFSVSNVFQQMRKGFHPWFSCHIFFSLMDIKPITFYGVFHHFSRTYKVKKSRMIEL